MFVQAAQSIAEAYFAQPPGVTALGRAGIGVPLVVLRQMLSPGRLRPDIRCHRARRRASDVDSGATLTLAAWIIAIKFRCSLHGGAGVALFGHTIFHDAGRWR